MTAGVDALHMQNDDRSKSGVLDDRELRKALFFNCLEGHLVLMQFNGVWIAVSSP